VGIIGKIELVSDIASLASGQIPASYGFRLFSMFFGRKKGLTKAKMKKMMMRKRRMFVDNVIMHHKRLHDQNREQIIEETKAKISSKVQKKVLAVPGNKPIIGQSRSSPKREQNSRSVSTQLKPSQGEHHKTRIQGLIDSERQKSRSKWAVRTKGNKSSAQEI